MTQEERELVLKDLCGRLPYGVIVHFCHTDITEKLTEISIGETINYLQENGKGNQGEVIPYLRPMSSMTMEEQREYISVGRGMSPDNPSVLADWLNAHHFDFRGLIPMGLALEAPEGMYK